MNKQSSASNSEAPPDNVQQISDAAVNAASAAGREARSLIGDALLTLQKGARFSWHTWLGAAIKAEELAVNTGKSFAQRGADFEKQAKKKINRQFDKANKSTEGLRKRARKRMADIESMVERGTDRSLHFLRVPTRGDVDQLTSLIQELADSVNELADKTGLPPKPNGNRGKKATESTTTA